MGAQVDDLLARMTPDEKVARLTAILPFDLIGAGGLDEQKFDEHLSEGSARSRRVHCSPLIPAHLVERTHLGIPARVLVQRGNWATDIAYHLGTVLEIETRRAH